MLGNALHQSQHPSHTFAAQFHIRHLPPPSTVPIHRCPSTLIGPSGHIPSSHLVGAQVLCPPLLLSINFCQPSWLHAYLSPHTDLFHLTHHHTTTSPPHGHPIPGPWGCYVHTWNGWGGLCPSLLDWVPLHMSLLQHCHQARAKPCRAGLHHFYHPLSSFLDNFHHPTIHLQAGFIIFIKLSLTTSIFACMCTCHGYHHPPRAAIALHIRLAYPPSTSWPSAITHPSNFK